MRNGLLATAVLQSLGAKGVKPQQFLIGYDGDGSGGKRKMSVAEMQANLLTAARGRVRIERTNGQEGNRKT